MPASRNIPADRRPWRGLVTGDGIDDAEWLWLAGHAPEPLRALLAIRARTAGVAYPPEVGTMLAAAHRDATLTFLARHHAFRELMATLDAAGVEAVVLKGVALAHIAYPEPAARVMSDIDLWIRDPSVDVRALLRPAGWRVAERHRLNEGTDFPAQLELEGTPVLLEAHTVPQAFGDHLPAGAVDAIWAGRCRTVLGGAPAFVLHPGDMLLHLALHGVKHGFAGGPRSMVDLAMFANAVGDAVDWEEVTRRYHMFGVARLMGVMLTVARDDYGARIPATALGALRDASTDELLRDAGVLRDGVPRLTYGLEAALHAPSIPARVSALVRWANVAYLAPLRDPGFTVAERVHRLVLRLGYDALVNTRKYGRAWRRGEIGASAAERMAAERRIGDLTRRLLARNPADLASPRQDDAGVAPR